MFGAALTARPLVATAWRRCVSDVGGRWLVGTAEPSDLAASLAGCPGPTVVLLDAPLASAEVVERTRDDRTRVLVLAPPVADGPLRSTLAAGVDGVVSVLDPLAVAPAALGDLVADGAHASTTGARFLLDALRDRRRGGRTARNTALSAREREVLRAMVDGLTTKATARRLGIASKTVEAHRKSVFIRLQVRTQREAVVVALTNPHLLDG